MKKLIAIILSVVTICALFGACSSGGESNKKKDASTTVTVNHIVETTTDKAKIKSTDAVELIKSYSAKDLDLTDKEKKECKFLTNNSGIKIGKDYYVSVIAAYEISEKGDDGKTYVKFDHRGEYYIRYDGKQVLRKNIKEKNPKEEYTELEIKK